MCKKTKSIGEKFRVIEPCGYKHSFTGRDKDCIRIGVAINKQLFGDVVEI